MINNPDNFEPYLYVGIGRTHAMYTLRETFLYPILERGRVSHYEIRSIHHQNLSIDLDKAIEKATELSEKMFATELRVNRDRIAEDLREIERMDADERAAAAEREAKELEERERQEQERRQEQLWMIEEDLVPFGRYHDTKIMELPASYCDWLIKSIDTFDDDSVIKILAERVRELRPETALPEPTTQNHVGEIKQRLDFNVTVIKQRGFDTFYGYSYVTTMVDDGGNCLVVFSGSFCPDIGAKLKIKATVKDHSEYDGQAQTIVQRVKILEEVQQ